MRPVPSVREKAERAVADFLAYRAKAQVLFPKRTNNGISVGYIKGASSGTSEEERR